ncbi:HAD family hydrolase, partial [Pricia sp.]|uniref:HAD family hydrolase n=1 Tax=Pricia sp. TaxID=2268138 RepID=UPI003594771C
MDLSRIKMVVTDMDGTLLNSDHEVSDRFLEIFQKLKERDILFVAASGRQYQSIVDKLASIKNDITVIA